VIDSFAGRNSFLSNFFPCKIRFEGITYLTSEHAFQAAKTLDIDERKLIALAPTAGKAKRMGRKLKLRRDWDSVRIEIMEAILRIKFSDPDLLTRLLETGTEELVEGNNWGDRFWGKVNGEGENQLGKLLMKIRATWDGVVND
jgi:ribA/ribD-fused uncharacterized protein